MMRKIILFLWVTALLAAGGCHRNVVRPTPTATQQPAATGEARPTDAPQTTAAPDHTAVPDASATNAPEQQTPDTDEPVRDASYREYEVTYPSRGVQVHATVVLPGSTSIGKTDDTTDTTGATETTGPASPDASAQPMDTAKPDTTAAGMSARSAEASASPESEMHAYTATATPEMHAYTSPMPISENEQPAG